MASCAAAPLVDTQEDIQLSLHLASTWKKSIRFLLAGGHPIPESIQQDMLYHSWIVAGIPDDKRPGYVSFVSSKMQPRQSAGSPSPTSATVPIPSSTDQAAAPPDSLSNEQPTNNPHAELGVGTSNGIMSLSHPWAIAQESNANQTHLGVDGSFESLGLGNASVPFGFGGDPINPGQVSETPNLYGIAAFQTPDGTSNQENPLQPSLPDSDDNAVAVISKQESQPPERGRKHPRPDDADHGTVPDNKRIRVNSAPATNPARIQRPSPSTKYCVGDPQSSGNLGPHCEARRPSPRSDKPGRRGFTSKKSFAAHFLPDHLDEHKDETFETTGAYKCAICKKLFYGNGDTLIHHYWVGRMSNQPCPTMTRELAV